MFNPEVSSEEEKKTDDYETKYSKGFEILDSFETEKQLKEAEEKKDAEEIAEMRNIAEQVNLMRVSLKEGDPKPLIKHITMMIENNMNFIKGDTQELPGGENTNRFKIVRNLIDILEQLKQED